MLLVVVFIFLVFVVDSSPFGIKRKRQQGDRQKKIEREREGDWGAHMGVSFHFAFYLPVLSPTLLLSPTKRGYRGRGKSQGQGQDFGECASTVSPTPEEQLGQDH